MLHAYWLMANRSLKMKAAKILKQKDGFIGFYPHSFDNDRWLVAIFDTELHASAARFDVETGVPIGASPSRVEDCKYM